MSTTENTDVNYVQIKQAVWLSLHTDSCKLNSQAGLMPLNRKLYILKRISILFMGCLLFETRAVLNNNANVSQPLQTCVVTASV